MGTRILAGAMMATRADVAGKRKDPARLSVYLPGSMRRVRASINGSSREPDAKLLHPELKR
jgi:hypothetical protein